MGQFYKTVVRPSMMYGFEYWVIKSKQRGNKNESCRNENAKYGATRMDRIWNEHIQEKF